MGFRRDPGPERGASSCVSQRGADPFGLLTPVCAGIGWCGARPMDWRRRPGPRPVRCPRQSEMIDHRTDRGAWLAPWNLRWGGRCTPCVRGCMRTGVNDSTAHELDAVWGFFRSGLEDFPARPVPQSTSKTAQMKGRAAIDHRQIAPWLCPQYALQRPQYKETAAQDPRAPDPLCRACLEARAGSARPQVLADQNAPSPPVVLKV